MRTLWALPLLLSACAFEGSRGQSDAGDEPEPVDGMPVDAKPSCVPDFVDTCGQTADNTDFIVSNITLNTDSDNRCKVIDQAEGPDICLLYFNRIEVQPGGLMLAHGNRALAMVAKDTLLIRGTLEVGSRRGRTNQPGAGRAGVAAELCAFTSPAEAADGGGAGGAGGTFLTRGGNGGVGNTDNSGGGLEDRPGGVPGTAIAAPAFLRGGCDGQVGAPDENAAPGAGGYGGGGVYLSAAAMDISGIILAGGAGGQGGGVDDGGGGGGSGGMIVAQSASLKVSGQLLATGGAGGQGGGGINAGESGDDATSPNPALGGNDANRGGNGGRGGIGVGATTTEGSVGGEDTAGGGGGGGGAGFILLLGPQIDTRGATIVPPATQRAR